MKALDIASRQGMLIRANRISISDPPAEPLAAETRRPESSGLAYCRVIGHNQLIANGLAPVSHIVAALSGQHIGLRSHNEVVPMQAADLVGPPRDRDTPPLSEQGGVVTLPLGEGADPVREAQRVAKVREMEDALEPGDPITLKQLPVWDVMPKLGDLRLGHAGRVAAAGHTLFARQGAHGNHLSSLTTMTSEKAEQIISKPPACDQSTTAGGALRGLPRV